MRLLRVLPLLLLLAGCHPDTPKPYQVIIHAPADVRTTTLLIQAPDNAVRLLDARGDATYQFDDREARIEVIRHGDPGKVRAELWHNGQLDRGAESNGPIEIIRIEIRPAGAKGI